MFSHKATHLCHMFSSAAQYSGPFLQGLLLVLFLEGKVLLHLWCDFRGAFPEQRAEVKTAGGGGVKHEKKTCFLG